MDNKRKNIEKNKKLHRILANVRAVAEGFLEQAANGMDMMQTNRPGDGLSLGERIKQKRAELLKRIEDRDAKKAKDAAVAAKIKGTQR